MAHVKAGKVLPQPLSLSDQRPDVAVPTAPLSDEVRHRLAVLQRLAHCQPSGDDSAEQKRAAAELGMTLRHLQRLQRQYQASGIAGVASHGNCRRSHASRHAG